MGVRVRDFPGKWLCLDVGYAAAILVSQLGSSLLMLAKGRYWLKCCTNELQKFLVRVRIRMSLLWFAVHGYVAVLCR